MNPAIPLGHDPPWLWLLLAHTFQRWIRGAQRSDANAEIDDVNMGVSFEHGSLRGRGALTQTSAARLLRWTGSSQCQRVLFQMRC